MAIRAVLWDVDDTVFDYTGSDRTAALRHLAAEGLLAGYATVTEAIDHWREVMDAQFKRFIAGEIDYFEHRRSRARAFLGKPLPDDEADAWFARYVHHYEAAWTLFPDVMPALDLLAAHFRHAVLSNADTIGQHRKLRVLGLSERFEHVLCADKLGCAKPDARAFRTACAKLELDPKEVVYVGDQLDTDAIAAQRAGLRGIWLDRSGRCSVREVPTGVQRIESLAELPDLLL